MPHRSLAELLDREDPMWPIIQQWLEAARHPIEVLPAAREDAENALLTLQVTTRSPLGAMAWETGGMLIQHGWLRLLGAGSPLRMRDSLASWNSSGEHLAVPLLARALLVGHDVLGGFFAMNQGAFDGQEHTIFYFAPDSLQWEELGLSYTDFLRWAVTGDVARFYADQRWPGWEQEVAEISGDQGWSFMPMLWAAGPAVGERSRRIVPQRELWMLHQELAQQLAEVPNGSRVRLHFTDSPKQPSE